MARAAAVRIEHLLDCPANRFFTRQFIEVASGRWFAPVEASRPLHLLGLPDEKSLVAKRFPFVVDKGRYRPLILQFEKLTGEAS